MAQAPQRDMIRDVMHDLSAMLSANKVLWNTLGQSRWLSLANTYLNVIEDEIAADEFHAYANAVARYYHYHHDQSPSPEWDVTTAPPSP